MLLNIFTSLQLKYFNDLNCIAPMDQLDLGTTGGWRKDYAFKIIKELKFNCLFIN